MSKRSLGPSKSKPTTIQNYTVKTPTTLLEFIQQVHSGKSRSAVKSMLKHRQVAINGVPVVVDTTPLLEGDVVAINTGKVPEKLTHDLMRIIWEDESIVVIDKKTGLLSVSSEREHEQTAYAILKQHVKTAGEHNKIFVLHRLDRDTSGVMMFAKSKEIQEQMQRSWNTVVTDRRYVLVVAGQVERNEGQVTTWLKQDNNNFQTLSSVDANGGQRSTTYYRVLRRSPEFTMLEATLDTGRKNQIRVHMKDLGHSIVGDKKYGGVKSPFQRLGLHAHILEFVHPVTGQKMRFESPIPRTFLALFK